jgi:Tfx family DNA-binding protein
MVCDQAPTLSSLALANIERAERTQRQWMMIRAPIFFKIEAGTDILDLPKMIFNAADKKGIELPITSLDIVMQLWQRSPLLCKNGGLAQNAEIFVTEEGDVLLEARKKNRDFP